jgi:hypothetical protein
MEERVMDGSPSSMARRADKQVTLCKVQEEEYDVTFFLGP